MLLVSELVTNAIRHGKGVVHLAVKQAPERLCVEVSDAGPGSPATRLPSAEEASGRGLLMVDRLSSDWGVTPSDGGGKTVWFALRTGRHR